MRRVCLGISAVSTFLFASCPENLANAMTLGDPTSPSRAQWEATGAGTNNAEPILIAR